jgi:histidinol dehydrogenase
VKLVSAAEHARVAKLMRAGWLAPDGVAETVAEILHDVSVRGDTALIEYARRFDDARFDISKLRVALPMLQAARSLVTPEIAAILETAKERIARFHERQRRPDLSYAEEDGTHYGLHVRPLESVAAYVPAGSASSVLAGVVAAKIAGVSRLVVLAAPEADGRVHPAVIFACSLCGVDELYAAGGAQAIAAAAFGTETIAPVEKIVGPGGVWVTEAKRQVFGRCGIDGLAGPSEVLVVADDGANSEFVVGELLAAAEQDARATLAVVSESRSLLDAVAQLVDTLDVKTMAHGETIAHALERNCHLVHASTRDEVFEVIERFAPAALSLQVRDAAPYLPRIRRAGTVFVGDATPVACGTYLAGTNAVLPTGGTVRFSSGLSLHDFVRTFAVLENSAERMTGDASAIAALAESEGLPQHAQTARMRVGG